MPERCDSCGQPKMPLCTRCGHSRSEHSIRELRKLLTRTRCFVADCDCPAYETSGPSEETP